MNVKTFLMGIIAFAAITQVASAQSTGDFRSNVASSPPYYWSNSANWQRYDGSAWQAAAAAPDSTNFVTIQAGDQITVDANASADHLKVESTGVLKVLNNATLVLDGDGNSGVSTIDGHIELGKDTATTSYGILQFTTNDQTLQGNPSTGYIDGLFAGCKIQIANGKILTSQMLLQGIFAMEPISGTVTFQNARTGVGTEGQVIANRSGNIEFNANVIMDDVKNGSNRPVFKVLGSGSSVMIFNRASDGSNVNLNPRLESNFVVDSTSGCAEFRFLANVETTGTLTLTDGKVTTNGAGDPHFYYDWVNSSTHTDITNCQAAGSCSC